MSENYNGRTELKIASNEVQIVSGMIHMCDNTNVHRSNELSLKQHPREKTFS